MSVAVAVLHMTRTVSRVALVVAAAVRLLVAESVGLACLVLALMVVLVLQVAHTAAAVEAVRQP